MSAKLIRDVRPGDFILWCGRSVKVLDKRVKHNPTYPTARLLVEGRNVSERWLNYDCDEEVSLGAPIRSDIEFYEDLFDSREVSR